MFRTKEDAIGVALLVLLLIVVFVLIGVSGYSLLGYLDSRPQENPGPKISTVKPAQATTTTIKFTSIPKLGARELVTLQSQYESATRSE